MPPRCNESKLARAGIDRVTIRVGGGRQTDLGPVDVQQAVRAAGGERGGLGRVDDVVRHAGDLGGEGGHGDKTLEGMDAHGKGPRSKAGAAAG